MDHSTPTLWQEGRIVYSDPEAEAQVRKLEDNCREFGLRLYELGNENQGVVHVIGPELGLTRPGMTVVCGDSHTSTHGAFGCLAFGIGTTEVGHVLATQCLIQHKPKTFAVRIEGAMPTGVSAKDLILAVISRIGVNGGIGRVIEYMGSTIHALSMEERMTVCNMSIEAGARAGMVAPDDTTYEYLSGRPFAPQGDDWERAVATWRKLPSDDGAQYDEEVTLDASALEPMITYGTNPGMSIPIQGAIPDCGSDPAAKKSLDYMGLESGRPLLGRRIDTVFIGSCTNSRLSDLRAAASVMKNRRVAKEVRTLIVPGSVKIKKEAEAEGLHEIFREAGAEWREAGCSMCIAMNGDKLEPGEYAVSTSNRNFEGRQGKGSRTFLASPLTAAASAVRGEVADVRELLEP
jgi:3-isopropylmalate/(R)-2-methylmalate dehydratase large subunit